MEEKKRLISYKGKIADIPISKLRPSMYNTYNTDEIQSLLDSIQTIGLMHALSVVGPDAKGYYEILSGERRYHSICKIREEDPEYMETVPCLVIADSDIGDIQKQIAIEVSNLEVRDIRDKDRHRMELVRLFYMLANAGKIPERKIAKKICEMTKLNPQYARMYMAVHTRGIPELQQAVVEPRDGENMHVTISTASRIAGFDEEMQKEILTRVEAGERAEDIIRALRLAQKEEKSSERETAQTDAGKTQESAVTNLSEEILEDVSPFGLEAEQVNAMEETESEMEESLEDASEGVLDIDSVKGNQTEHNEKTSRQASIEEPFQKDANGMTVYDYMELDRLGELDISKLDVHSLFSKENQQVNMNLSASGFGGSRNYSLGESEEETGAFSHTPGRRAERAEASYMPEASRIHSVEWNDGPAMKAGDSGISRITKEMRRTIIEWVKVLEDLNHHDIPCGEENLHIMEQITRLYQNFSHRK